MPNAVKHHIARTLPSDTAHASIDTIHADTVQAHYAPKYIAGFPDTTGNDMAFRHLDEMKDMTVPASVSDGQPRPSSPLHDTGVMSILLLIFFIITLSYRQGFKYLSSFGHNIFSVKRRQNMFDDHTVNETQIMFALIANTCLLEGIILFFAIPLIDSSVVLSFSVLEYVGLLAGSAVLFFFVQLIGYYILGFVFSDSLSTKLWLDCFKASQSLLGLLLLPVTFIMLLYPTSTHIMIICSIILYFSARFVFVCKGFRIFFNNLTSLLYFILYLCSVEIVPLILFLSGTVYLCRILQS